MPWEKDFDIDAALADAMGEFWEKGYEATSISDLTKAMKINKGSLYNAFGGKKELFIQAVSKYSRENLQASLKELEQMEDPLESINSLFEGLVAESMADEKKRGCFLVNTAVELPNQTDDVRLIITAAFDDLERFFARRIVEGQTNGSILTSLDPQEMAKSLLTQVVGFRVLARGVFTIEGLKAIQNQAVASLRA